MSDVFVALLIIGMFFPIVALVGAIWLFLEGMTGLAFWLFIWWLLWA